MKRALLVLILVLAATRGRTIFRCLSLMWGRVTPCSFARPKGKSPWLMPARQAGYWTFSSGRASRR